jgi:hypothetical protein
MKRQFFFGLLGALTVLAAFPSLACACAVCLTGADDPSADAFNWSVLFLMAAPYLVFGSIGGCLFYLYRRASKRRDSPQAGASLVHLALNQKESGR